MTGLIAVDVVSKTQRVETNGLVLTLSAFQ